MKYTLSIQIKTLWSSKALIRGTACGKRSGSLRQCAAPFHDVADQNVLEGRSTWAALPGAAVDGEGESLVMAQRGSSHIADPVTNDIGGVQKRGTLFHEGLRSWPRTHLVEGRTDVQGAHRQGLLPLGSLLQPRRQNRHDIQELKTRVEANDGRIGGLADRHHLNRVCLGLADARHGVRPALQSVLAWPALSVPAHAPSARALRRGVLPYAPRAPLSTSLPMF